MVDPKATRFWQQATQSGLIDAQALMSCWLRVPEAKRTTDGAERRLARQAVDAGLLTVWQAQQFLSNRAGSLKIEKYVMLDRLGVGGMGRVYLARDTRLGRRVAIKLLSPERLSNPRALARFLREAKVGAQLQHENLVRIYDEGESNGIPFLVMELIEGKTLHRLFLDQGQMPPRIAANLGRQVALGLEHAHQKGLIHRDVNPMNIMVTAEGVAKLTDLGLALDVADGEGALTRDGMTVGTFDYISPEQARASRDVDTRADIYSLGCTLYHLITGGVPFPTSSLPEKLYAHQASEPPPLENSAGDVPPGLAAVISKMMAKRPDDRYSTPMRVAEALEPFQGSGRPVIPWPKQERVPEPSPEAALLTAGVNRDVDPFGSSGPLGGSSGLSEDLISPLGSSPSARSESGANPWVSGDSGFPAGSGSTSRDEPVATPPRPHSATGGAPPASTLPPDSEGVELDDDDEAEPDDPSAIFDVARFASVSGEPATTGIVVVEPFVSNDLPTRERPRGPGPVRRGKGLPLKAINVVTVLLILGLGLGLIARSVSRRLSAFVPRGPSIERDNGRGAFLTSSKGKAIQYRVTGGDLATAADLREALVNVGSKGGEVVLSGVSGKSIAIDAPLEITGAVEIRGEPGSGAILVARSVAEPWLRVKSGASLILEGLTLAESCNRKGGSRLIEAEGELTLRRCLVWTNDGEEDSRGIVASGPKVTLDGCGFRGYARAVDLALSPGATLSLHHCLFAWSKADRRKTGWALRVAGRGEAAERSLVLDHCTVGGGGLLDVGEGFTVAQPLAVTCSRTAALVDSLLLWESSPAEFPKAIHWKGEGNRYDVQKTAWVVLPPSGFDALPGGPDDPASWQKVCPETALIAKSFHFVGPDSGIFDASHYALADADARGVGADVSRVGPTALGR